MPSVAEFVSPAAAMLDGSRPLEEILSLGGISYIERKRMKKIQMFFTPFPPSLSSGGKLMVVKQLFKRVFLEGPPLVMALKGSKYGRKDHLF